MPLPTSIQSTCKPSPQKSPKRRSSKAQPGDVIAIPSPDGGYYFVVLLATNTFGWAFGILQGKHKARRLAAAATLKPLPQHVYSGGRFVANGRWPVIACRPDLLQLFPTDPEIYHRKSDHRDNPNIGEYGSGETAAGKLRNLTKQEAEEIGLLTREYKQGWLEEIFEQYLAKKLG